MDEPRLRTHLVLGALATWRLSHLLAEEDGPGEVLARLRGRLEGGPLAPLAGCFDCVSVWAAAPVALAVVRGRAGVVITGLGLSGAACLLRRATESPPLIVPVGQIGEEDR